MPRPNKPRSIDAEFALARRVAYERERRDWSYEALASRMTKAGCPIQASGLYKIEKAGRRITVDELVGLAKAFDVDVPELLQPVEMILHEDINRAEAGEYEAYMAWYTAAFDLIDARRARADLYKKAMSGENAALGEAMEAYWHELELQRIAQAERAQERAAAGGGTLAARVVDHLAEEDSRVANMSDADLAERERRREGVRRLDEAATDFYEVIREVADPDGVLGDS
jgi:transcriptional regulator with XRE-family HTH domain